MITRSVPTMSKADSDSAAPAGSGRWRAPRVEGWGGRPPWAEEVEPGRDGLALRLLVAIGFPKNADAAH